MSAGLAIPATTTVLRAILMARLRTSYGSMRVPPVLIAPPPPRSAVPATELAAQQPPVEEAALHLFLYHASPNASLRNRFDPGMDSAGQRIARVPLVLDLHYLLAASGADLEREALLGIALHAFHRNAILPRPMIESLLATSTAPDDPTRLTDLIPDEPLFQREHQPQQITLSPLPADLDALTKLWSALQSPLRPSALFLVTTVFLDNDEPVTPPRRVDEVDLGLRPDAARGTPPLEQVVIRPPQEEA